jgi:hypothetical protein
MISQRLPKWIWVAGLLALAGSAGIEAAETPPATPETQSAPEAAGGTPNNSGGDGNTPRITAVDRTEAAREDWVTFSVAGTWPGPAAIYLDGRQVGTATIRKDNRFVWQVPGCDGACRGGSDKCDKSCEQCAKSSQDSGCTDCREQVSLGTHDLQIVLPQEDDSLLVPLPSGNNQITIVKRTQGDPKITGIFPAPSYPGEDSSYEMMIQGDGFAENACDNEIYLGGEWIDVCWQKNGDDKTCRQKFADLPQGHLVNSRKIALSNLGQSDRELVDLAVGVGGKVSDPVKIRLSLVKRNTPLWAALVGFGLILVLVLLITSRGFKGDSIGGQRYNFGSALLLDKETDTYSLSRFQFYVWTAVAILGYLYLAISRSLVQGSLDFVDIPEGLPGIVFISAGTSVLAQWTQSLRGPKGAGNVRPSFSDLITSGGVVAPERFQFFVWTVLGAGAFLALVILRNPGTIADLPKVPEGFLQLMGVSSVGYLGGKLARKPGPVLDEVLVTSGSLVLTLRGRGLSVDAGFRIGGDEIPSMLIAEPNHKPAILEKDEQSDDPTLAKVLRLTITEPKPEWAKEGVELTIVNPDGQKAIWPCHWPMTSDQPVTSPAPGGAAG